MGNNEYKLRVELIAKRKSKYKFIRVRKTNKLVQNEPTELYFKFTNIGNIPSPPINISDFSLSSNAEAIFIQSINKLYVKPLNPNESIEVLQDNVSIGYKGTAWVSLKINANEEGSTVLAYQHNESYNTDDVYHLPNEWGNIEYVQGELEILQHKTNTLIFVLTIITTIESIFGMKEFVKFFLIILYHPIYLAAEFLSAAIK